ncbi:MAG: helix-turn-helix domain-containing protein [Halobacteriaceae archaeon]
MATATVRLTLPKGSWIGALSREHDGTQFRVVSVVSRDDDGGIGLLEVRTEDPAAIVTAARDHEEIAALEVLEVTDNRVLFQFETGAPHLLEIAKNAGIPVVTPFSITDGEAVWELTAAREQLSNLAAELAATGISYTVESVRPDADAESLLSDRQATLLTEAVQRGYYDTPRTCTLTDLAEATGIAKSTCSETLHRAEGAIIKEFTDTQLAAEQGVLTPNGTE